LLADEGCGLCCIIGFLSELALDLRRLLLQCLVDVLVTTDGLYSLDSFRRTSRRVNPLVPVLPRRGDAIARFDVKRPPLPVIRWSVISGTGRDIEQLRRLRLAAAHLYEFDGLHTIVLMTTKGSTAPSTPRLASSTLGAA
jgi:hypothetical protein